MKEHTATGTAQKLRNFRRNVIEAETAHCIANIRLERGFPEGVDRQTNLVDEVHSRIDVVAG
jgi:hypothetical protein